MNPLRLIRTSTFQLAWWYMGIFGASTLILVGSFYWTTTGYLEEQTNATVQAEVTGLFEQYSQRGLVGLEIAIRERAAAGAETALYLLAAPDLTPLAGNLNAWPAGTVDEAGWFNFVHVTAEGSVPARGRIVVLDKDRRLLVAQSLSRQAAANRRINQAFGWALAMGMLLALLGGIIMSSSIVRRIDVINRTSREIMEGRLKRRVPVRGIDDEFDQLADNLNAMLDRIDTLVEGVKAVADNIAHDLRTPLTRLRGRLETLALRAGQDDPVREELRACITEADHLLATFRALLRIARLESGTHEQAWKTLRLGQLVADAWELYHAVGEDKDIDVHYLGGDATVEGDADLLFQAVSNLLDNAIKYSPPGSRVEVRVDGAGDGAAVIVADHGPGIPAGERDKVLDRFYRSATVAGTPGSGLGLSLVNAIARHHGGRLELDDNAPGLKISLWLPRAETAGEVASPPAAAAAGP